jgi:hypothetical protein
MKTFPDKGQIKEQTCALSGKEQKTGSDHPTTTSSWDGLAVKVDA